MRPHESAPGRSGDYFGLSAAYEAFEPVASRKPIRPEARRPSRLSGRRPGVSVCSFFHISVSGILAATQRGFRMIPFAIMARPPSPPGATGAAPFPSTDSDPLAVSLRVATYPNQPLEDNGGRPGSRVPFVRAHSLSLARRAADRCSAAGVPWRFSGMLQPRSDSQPPSRCVRRPHSWPAGST